MNPDDPAMRRLMAATETLIAALRLLATSLDGELCFQRGCWRDVVAGKIQHVGPCADVRALVVPLIGEST